MNFNNPKQQILKERMMCQKLNKENYIPLLQYNSSLLHNIPNRQSKGQRQHTKTSSQYQSQFYEQQQQIQKFLFNLQEKSCIIQKLDLENQTLRQRLEEKNKLEQVIHQLKAQIKDMKDIQIQLQVKCQKERQNYLSIIEEKDFIIEEFMRNIQRLEEEIGSLEEDNSYLEKRVIGMEESFNSEMRETVIFNRNFDNCSLLSQRKCLSPKKSDRSSNKKSNLKIFDLNYKMQLLENKYEREIQQIVGFYQNQISIIRQVLGKGISEYSYKRNMMSNSSQKDLIPQQLISVKSFFKISDLRSQLCNKNQKNQDQNISQFTSKYFNYHGKEQKQKKCQIRDSPKLINFQENYQIQDEQSQPTLSIKITNRQILFAFGGFVGGMFATYYTEKI